jgi:fluoride ion exporter CrcB/FEX
MTTYAQLDKALRSTAMGLVVRAIGCAALGAFLIWAVGLTAGQSHERQWRIAIGVGLIAASHR